MRCNKMCGICFSKTLSHIRLCSRPCTSELRQMIGPQKRPRALPRSMAQALTLLRDGLSDISYAMEAPWKLREAPPLYVPPQLLHYKNNGFCNISIAMEAPWKPREARVCMGLHSFCIVETMVFATSHMPWTLHGGSGRPVSVRASTASAR